jgi:hypothetical protein
MRKPFLQALPLRLKNFPAGQVKIPHRQAERDSVLFMNFQSSKIILHL